MPTAGDFEAVADGLQVLIGQLEDLALPLENHMGAHVLEGGELTDSVYASIKETRVTALSLSAIVDEYRNEAVRRLEEARAAIQAREDYQDDVANYNEQMGYWERQENGENPGNGWKKLDEEPTPPAPPPAPPDYIDL